MADKDKEPKENLNILEDPDIVLDQEEDTLEEEFKKTKAHYDKIRNMKYVDDQYDENLDIFKTDEDPKPKKYKELNIEEK